MRKFKSANSELTWVRLLESILRENGRPCISVHLLLGYHEWISTAEAIATNYPFWAEVFRVGANLVLLSHRFDQCWPLIPITGYEEADFQQLDISSLAYRNPAARSLVDAGLVNVGQLFMTNDLGQVDRTQVKPYNLLENEFGIIFTQPIKNSLTGLINHIRRRFDGSTTFLAMPTTTIKSLIGIFKSGCHAATRLLLRQQRSGWEWGDMIRSYFTYSRDQLINISSVEFSKSFYRSRRSTLPPSMQWNSIQILLRTLWTNVKEQRTTRRILDQNVGNPLCTNCHSHPEHTVHLMFHCQTAQGVWIVIAEKFNDAVKTVRNTQTTIQLTMDTIMYNHPPDYLREQEVRDCIDIVMLVKHVLYRLRFRTNIEAIPSTRRILVECAIELEKANTVRYSLNRFSVVFTKFTELIKTFVGF